MMWSLRHQCLLLFCICVCLLVWRAFMLQNTSWLVTLFLSLTAGVSIDMFRLKPSPYHTYSSLLRHYFFTKASLILSSIVKPRFNHASFNVEEVQTKTLMKILKNNAGSTFSLEHNLDKVKTVDEFRKTMPQSIFNDYLPYNKRAVEGEANVFFPQPVDFIATTTGTTSGESKKYPKSSKLTGMVSLDVLGLISCVFCDIPGLNGLQKMMCCSFSKPPALTSSGVRIGPISSLSGLSGSPYLTTPKAANGIAKEEYTIYVDLLFGLRDETISIIYGFVTAVLLKIFKTLERHWRTLCDDIEKGTLYTGISIDENIRAELESLCRPDPTRAAKLRLEFQKGFDGIVPRIWPNCKLVHAIASGTFQVYADIVKDKYLGGVLLFSQVHISTEEVLGLSIWPEWNEDIYSPILELIFYEWLPVDRDEGESVLTHQVELGKEYEMVITTMQGLYRYRTEDVVKFTKKYYHLPIYEFVRRKGDTLNLHTLKIPESIASQALLETFRELKDVGLLDYTFVESLYYERTVGEVSGDMYYVVFAEVEGDVTQVEEIERQMDKKISYMAPSYGGCREKGTLKQLKVFPLSLGTFARFKTERLAINKLAGSMQFKVPRIVRQEEIIRFFEEERQRNSDNIRHEMSKFKSVN